MINKKFGKLTVLALSCKKGKNRNVYYDCICECGESTISRVDALRNGKAAMCSKCYKIKNSTHQMAGSNFYSVWSSLSQRCNNKSHKAYKNYGGRGIKVEWSSFEEFRDAMYSSYKKGLEIDRKDNDGNYSTNNCRWVTRAVNQSNKRVMGKIPFRGVCKVAGKYRASLKKKDENKMTHLGTYNTAIEAAKAYDNYVIVNNLDKKLNFKIKEAI